MAEQFAVEIDTTGVDSLAQLNRWWAGWVEQVYHHRVHTSTGQTPLERWTAGAERVFLAPDQAMLTAVFRWSATRTVGKTATVSLHGNRYTVDPALVGYRVELRYDPQDLTRIAVYVRDDYRGDATPERIGTHVDPKLRQPPEPGPPTGIDYLQAIAADHAAACQQGLSYHQPPLFPTADTDTADTADDQETPR